MEVTFRAWEPLPPRADGRIDLHVSFRGLAGPRAAMADILGRLHGPWAEGADGWTEYAEYRRLRPNKAPAGLPWC